MSLMLALAAGIVIGMACPFIAFIVFKDVIMRFLNTMSAKQTAQPKPTMADVAQVQEALTAAGLTMRNVKTGKQKPFRATKQDVDNGDVT